MTAIHVPVHRRGSLLVVMLGLVLLMLGMTLAIATRVKSSIDQSNLIERHAQAYLMARAAKLYLQAKFTEAGRNTAEYQSDPMKIIGTTTGAAVTGGDGSVGGVAELVSALGGLSERQGWYHLRRSSATAATLIAAGGGGGISSGSSPQQTKRSTSGIHAVLGQPDAREAFDVVYVYDVTLPLAAGTTAAGLSLAPVPTATKANTSYW